MNDPKATLVKFDWPDMPLDTPSPHQRRPLHEVLGAETLAAVARESGNTASVTKLGHELLEKLNAAGSPDVIGGVIDSSGGKDRLYYVNQGDRIVEISDQIEGGRGIWRQHVRVAVSDFTGDSLDELQQKGRLLSHASERNNDQGLFAAFYDCVRAELLVRQEQEQRDRTRLVYDSQAAQPTQLGRGARMGLGYAGQVAPHPERPERRSSNVKPQP